MQALESDPQYAVNVRAALEELLRWEPTLAEAQTFLNAILRFHPTPESRLRAWAELVDLHENLEALRDGDDPGFDDLGGGHYVTLDRETAIERAESDFEAALDAVAGISPVTCSRAA